MPDEEMSTPPPLARLAQSHLDQARHNYDVYHKLARDPQDLDWALTTLFYSAMHLVQSYAAQLRTTKPSALYPKTHPDCESFVARELPRLFGPYRRLFDMSRRTRYQFYLPTSEAVRQMHDEAFARVRDEVAALGIPWLP